jgi:hypothetical protein
MTTQQAASYIITALSVNKEGKVTTEAVDALSKAWGSSKEQAEKYLDFTLALADNVLSDKEIAKLQEKWGLTEKQVRQYADFTVKIADYKLDDTEINDLMGKWGLTREEVLKYVAQIGAPVSWNGQLTDPADEAERKWKAALAALMAYQAALAGGVGSSASSSSSSSSSSAASTAAAAASTAASAAASASASASKAAAEAYAKAKAAGDMNAAAIAAAGVTPSALAAGESGAIGAASIAAQLRAAETALAVQKNATTLANFKAKEAEDLAASVAARAQLDYDERSKFRSMTLANASSVSGTSGSGAVTVNLTVNGSVSTEKDLVATVRQGLLAGQYNGQTLTLEAI